MVLDFVQNNKKLKPKAQSLAEKGRIVSAVLEELCNKTEFEVAFDVKKVYGRVQHLAYKSIDCFYSSLKIATSVLGLVHTATNMNLSTFKVDLTKELDLEESDLAPRLSITRCF